MRIFAAFTAFLMLTIGLPACGKYGPPVRTVVPKNQDRADPQATDTQSQVPEEKIRAPADFDDAWDDGEVIP